MRSSIKIGSRIILMIPSYFDFVRVRNYLKEHNYEFAQFSEYTSNPKISKGRLQFFKGEVKLLLVTERFHFFKRYHIRGSYQTVFYSVPMRSDFYTEYVNRLEIDAARGEAGVSVIYTRFDQSAMERIVGADRCKRMCEEGAKEAYMFT